MVTLNINTISDFPEELIIAKMDIESKLIDDGIIKEKQTLQDFIIRLSLQDNVYMKGKDIIPFKLIDGKKEKYLVYVNDDTKHKQAFEDLLDKLKSVNFDVNRFTKQDINMMLKHDVDKDQLFIINGNYYE